jgi:hypothetical protein
MINPQNQIDSKIHKQWIRKGLVLQTQYSTDNILAKGSTCQSYLFAIELR